MEIREGRNRVQSAKRVAGWVVLFGAFLYGGYLVGHSTTGVSSETHHTTSKPIHTASHPLASGHPSSSVSVHGTRASSGTSGTATATATATSGLQAGQFAPGFTLRTTTGARVSLSQLRGHPVWLNFWATWCPWCRKEIPELEKVQQEYGKQVDIYGVAVQQPQETVSQYMAQAHMNYPVLLDAQGSVAALYGIEFYPTSVFISPGGKILAVYQGAFLSEHNMRPYLQRLLHS